MSGFFRRWKQGILDLTPVQQLRAKLIGIVGGIAGLILALATLVYRRMWGFGIFVFFIIWLQFISFIGTRQQYLSTKEMMSEFEVQEQDMDSPKVDSELGNIKQGR